MELKHDKILLILRGLPGSGKTTLAHILKSEHDKVFSIDDYFTHEQTGEYMFDYKQNYLAYAQCLLNVKEAMESNIPKIIIHNTFIKIEEMEAYFKLAGEHEYAIFVMTIEKYHNGINSHDISNEQILKMKEKYQIKLI